MRKGAVLLYESHVEHQRLFHALDPYGDLLVLVSIQTSLRAVICARKLVYR